MTTMKDVPVLIVGAGPTGLALGCDLARRGIGFRMVNKAEAAFIGSKGKGLQPRSLEVMDDFGILEQVVGNGQFHLPFRAYDGATVLGERDVHEGRNPTPSTPYASVLITPQWRVEEALTQLLERNGGKVEFGTELVGLEQDADGATVTLVHAGARETARFRYVVACDGGKSFVRKLLKVPFEGETWTDERMYVGDVRVRGLDRKAWHTWTKHPEGFLALCPLPSTEGYQLQAGIAPDEEREPTFEVFREIVAARTGEMDVEVLEATWCSLYRVNVRMVSRYRMGQVFLAGDAAHVHSPAGGQGMNTGIQDAYNLGWKLGCVLNGAADALLDTYEEERLPVAAEVLGISSRLHRAMSSEEDQKMRRDAMTLQLGISYEGCSLSRQAGDVGLKIAAGDRAPDAPGVTETGVPVQLFDVFRGPQFTVLRLFPAEGAGAVQLEGVSCVDVVASPRGGARFVDAGGHVADAYGGGHGGFVLVRPDGYVGWVGMDAGALKEYLEQFALRGNDGELGG